MIPNIVLAVAIMLSLGTVQSAPTGWFGGLFKPSSATNNAAAKPSGIGESPKTFTQQWNKVATGGTAPSASQKSLGNPTSKVWLDAKSFFNLGRNKGSKVESTVPRRPNLARPAMALPKVREDRPLLAHSSALQ